MANPVPPSIPWTSCLINTHGNIPHVLRWEHNTHFRNEGAEWSHDELSDSTDVFPNHINWVCEEVNSWPLVMSLPSLIGFSLIQTSAPTVSVRSSQGNSTLWILFPQNNTTLYWGLVVHGAMGCGQKIFQLVWRCHQLLSGFIAKGHLPECRVSHVGR